MSKDDTVIIKKDGLMPYPEWFEYIVWTYDEDGFPIMKGFRKDTPKEMLKKYRKDTKQLAELVEDDPFGHYI